MGMYTRFSGQVLVKPEYRAMIADLCDWEKTPGCWWDLANMNPQHRWLVKYAGVSRSNFIPRGAYASADPVYHITDDGVWTIDCELKNYEDTIASFMNLIIPNIAIKAEMFSHYEEDEDAIAINYHSPEIAMAPELGNKEELDLGLSPCLGGSREGLA